MNSPRKSALYVIIMLVIFAIGLYFLANNKSPQGHMSDLEQQLPIISTIKKISPETYQNLEQLMAQYTSVGESERRQLFDKVVGSVMKVVGERMPYASDKAVIHFANSVNNYLAALLKEDPSGRSCFNNLFPHLRDSTLIVSPQESQDILIKQLDAIDKLLISSEDSQMQYELSEFEVTELLKKVHSQLQQQYGDKIELLNDLNSAKNQAADICNMTMSFYQDILAIPDQQEKASLLRQLFSQ